MRSTLEISNKEFLDRVSNKARKYHSSFQIEHFMARRGNVTSWGDYVQVLRELASRRDAQELCQIEIDRLEEMCEGLATYEAREAKIRLRDARISFDQRQREIDKLIEIARPLEEAYGNLSQEEQDELERREWISRLKVTLRLEMIFMGRPSIDTVETVFALGSEDRELLLEELKVSQPPEVLLREIGRLKDGEKHTIPASAILR